ncbi:MAG: FAD-dependent oxidoreductase, partial [Victivallaceae bacterium]
MANHQYKKFATNANDVTIATMNGRQEIHKQIAALRSRGGCWKNIRLVATAEHIGTREGRRIKGIYKVTDEDAIAGVRHDDAVCRANCKLDVHALNPEHNQGIEKTKFTTLPYDIPLRALISADVPNLMMAGRCISGDFYAHSSYRMTGVAAPLGEAAGVAAAIASKRGINPAQVPFEEIKAKL